MNKGSEWNKWDLHVHTASSYDAYKGEDADELLIKAWKEKGITAVAITDHFKIDKERIENLRKLAPNITIFPGVELRTDKGATNLHVILIFSENINLKKLSSAFDVIMLDGKAKSKEDNEKIYWDFEDILEFANSRDGLVSLHTGRKTSGMDKVITNSLPINIAIKKEIASKVHIYEIGQVKDIHDHKKNIFPHIGIKPLIICSDNHDPRNYVLKEYLWIKADSTFEGLKQVIHEPEDRVRIQKYMPEPKNDYEIIDKITFNDENGKEVVVNFNQNLNTIIGGKSTGKSLLLKNIVNNIDKEQLDDKLKIQKEFLELNKFSVKWRDGIDSEMARKIEYIPQSFLNRLMDDVDSETTIDEIAKEVLLQNKERKDSLKKLKIECEETEKETESLVDDYFDLEDEIVEVRKELKDIGLKEGIERNRDELSNKINQLKTDSGMSKEEIREMESLRAKLIDSKQKNEAIEKEVSELKEIMKLECYNDLFLEKASNSKNVSVKIEVVLNRIREDINKIISERIEEIEKEASKFNLELKEAKIKIEPFRKKIENQEELKKTEEQFLEENKKLDKIKQLNLDLYYFKEKKEENLRQILKELSDYQAIFSESLDSELWKAKFGEIKITPKVIFSKEKWGNIYSNLNGTSLRRYSEYSMEEIPNTKNIKKLFELILNEKIKIKSGIEKKDLLKRIARNNYIIKFEVKEGENDINQMSEGNRSFVLLEMILELNEGKYPIIIDQPEDDLDNRSIYNDLVRFIRNKKSQRQIILATHNANVVVGADAENVIVANQHGIKTENENEIRFDYKNGSLENQIKNKDGKTLEKNTVKEHICEILEGGEIAFESRRKKYNFN
ncbi:MULTISPECIES: TrlF family AAA-like ATPase [Psychrilyobacter]|uniref:Polymerase/histidinol phosphatase N-terminal domain-containing protein n=1 Tax=Psychrilyobacter piezotolerans TaxID=2293438 RepID=A0ABX9KFJ3_9FUSO|nr:MULTISPECIES: PHP domain-containing protein [Psychrilyobacter]MCS5421593.1 PHP domain-containing protein [Psychrilyobacter sp. S5]NDI78163.1 hypothetical protein [Psychrilyobacter piezotolerans]RDE60145.1 hypothetical protein DV867_11420 [Psychrilyobacter sp. S5]REI40327.1 hypothetical protein DYH56_11420 [Psychrilyobacter piezotolerans]